MNKSVHCTTGAHDRCRDGAALACACNCGHKRFRDESREQAVYDQAVYDQAKEEGGPNSRV